MASQQLHPAAKDPMDQLQDMLNLVVSIMRSGRVVQVEWELTHACS